MSEQTQQRGGALRALAIAGLVVALGAAGAWQWMTGAPGGSGAPEVVFVVPPGSTAQRVGGELEELGLIRSARGFRLLLRLKGDARRLRAGEFALRASMDAGQVIDALIRGPFVLHQVTIPEGFSARQIAARLAAEGFGTEEKFRELMFSAAFADRLDIPGPSLEGYLFPTTYSFSRPFTEERVLSAMVAETRKHLPPVIPESVRARGITDNHKLLTLASIVEKETGVPHERPYIAAVFLNRLAKGMRLETDPTVIYGIGEDYDGNIRRKDLETWTPYNTYRIKGLPPGPIASPGAEAIDAVLHPAEADYLFFVAKQSEHGVHYFSETYPLHEQAVRYFQLGKGKAPPAQDLKPAE
ncbi:MAG: endolytic transglycosylase MltG [Chrysiogenetes bacterium]|nr:endolytic transglycosylase MltG [Chrysiogenetes bacterium]